ncbi:polyketide synthase [Cellulomonas sp. SLBN-39]|uniref:beta-ketoacyl [acyl carrier protein] synthase domain-containing protein n=1 Tax=Cellulomonas sp. SLBN-39 TaxID=2768446 RepID=UPI0011681B29|nr:polyketide synthase [Cellulomonas sp. SLBN-39]TQL04578.1 beta-ketoacyl synthase-like protein [Cellulomonas sp. SLBN-39]
MSNHTLIAVTSAAARCAGADDLDEFWNLVQCAQPQFCAVPADRWPPPPDSGSRDGARRAGAHVMAPLADPYAFDARAHGVPAARARRMDPQQRLVLGLAAELFARARTDVRRPGARVATVVGVSSTDYRAVSTAPLLAAMTVDGALGTGTADERAAVRTAGARAVRPLTGHTMPGVLPNMVPAAVQHAFDLRGPAFAVDSACASSLTALDVARAMLATGAVDACVVGGVYTALTPEAHAGFSAIGALSPSGACRPYTRAADGFVIGEGGALLLLRRLEDAERDGDDVLAVVEACGSANDGRAPGVMTPTVAGQVAAVRAARADGPPVDAVEGHGTGTVVGDRTELETLRAVVPDATPGSVPLGSVKAVVGHTMAASAALALVKVLLALRHGRWTPQPADDAGWHPLLDGSPFAVPTPGDPPARVRRVAVNAFGFGGTNAHAVLAHPEAVVGRG